MVMKVSTAGLNAIMQREGSRSTAYRDSRGIWTIGVGHTGPEVREGLSWSEVQIKDALTQDIGWAEHAVNSTIKVPMTQNQFDAFVSVCFNIGAHGFENSSMARLFNEGVQASARAFMLWDRPAEIIGRRTAEMKQFMI